MKISYFLAFVLLLCISCSKETDEQAAVITDFPGFSVHTIREGQHYAETNRFQVFGRDQLRFDVVFDSSAVYSTRFPENMLDINKLYGFSDCATQHHANSARFGWRWNGKSVDILAYTYIDGKRQSKMLGVSELNKEYSYALTINRHEYIFEFNGQQVKMPRYCDTDIASGYLLYPYFGGDEAAPHDVSIFIREIDGKNS